MSAAPDTISGSNEAIRFLLDGQVHEIRDIDPTTTVLNYLRERLRRTGTKEGCAEGDCGACTIVVAELHGQGVRFRALNSCIQFVPTLDGKALFTVESLKLPDGRLHPVQQAMVDRHASQCGFCTPGFVMSLFALYKSADEAPDRERVNDALAGNLCRCTGYRPIVDAAGHMYALGRALPSADRTLLSEPGVPDPAAEHVRALIAQLRALARADTLAVHGAGKRFHAPRTSDELAALRLADPDARLLAGGTDVGLWVTKDHQDLGSVIHTAQVAELATSQRRDTYLEVGAGVTLSDFETVMAEHYPELIELLRRFGSPPIRNAATLAGNVANGSPIGDTMPALICLGTSLQLRRGEDRRILPLDQFYLGYRRTALAPGEFIEALRIPLRAPDLLLRSYKISKRFDQDISAVCGAYALRLDGERVREIRICYGGMAAMPQRAPACEQVLAGAPWTEASLAAAMAALERDYTPIDDMRASARYRRGIAARLLRRFFLETSGYRGRTRLTGAISGAGA